MFHATAVEVLLYLTPVHCQDMLDSLTTSLNATFTTFMKRNPSFQVRCPPPLLSPQTLCAFPRPAHAVAAALCRMFVRLSVLHTHIL